MKFKLVIAMVEDHNTEKAIEKAREMGATGATVIRPGQSVGCNPA